MLIGEEKIINTQYLDLPAIVKVVIAEQYLDKFLVFWFGESRLVDGEGQFLDLR